MNDPSQPAPSPADSPQSEDVENDAVIGSALRKSLLVFVIGALPVIGILIFLNLRKQQEESTEKEVVLPNLRDINVAEIPRLPLVEVTAECGIDFVHETGRYGDKLLPETMGGGVAIFDSNDDGHLDILFVNSSRWPWDESRPADTPCKLYQGDGKLNFKDVSAEAGFDFTIYGMGVAVGDIDNDGDTDVFLSAVGRNRLLRNDGGKFVDVTAMAGVAGSEDSWGTSCGFFDYDNDGKLDLYVCNYVGWSKEEDLKQGFSLDGESRTYGPPIYFKGSFSYLYHNEGGGTFRDVSEAAGIQIRNDDTGVPLGKAMGLAPIDVDGDGWIDLIVANDTVRNFFFKNNRDGTFTEIGRVSGIAFDRESGNPRGAMGTDAARLRDDGTLAICIGNFANEASALYTASPGDTQFEDRAMSTGLGPPTRKGLTFGMFFFDVDLDSRLDVLGANGHLEEDIAKVQRTQKYEQSPQLFWNAGLMAPNEFVQVGESKTGESFAVPIVGRGTAYGDLDSDGDSDFVIAVSGASPRLFRNDQATGHHWLRIRLTGRDCNRDAIGAVATIELADRTLSRQVMPTRSYLSQSEREVTFGLGTAGDISSVTIAWPGGSVERFTLDGVDRLVELVQGEGEAEETSANSL